VALPAASRTAAVKPTEVNALKRSSAFKSACVSSECSCPPPALQGPLGWNVRLAVDITREIVSVAGFSCAAAGALAPVGPASAQVRSDGGPHESDASRCGTAGGSERRRRRCRTRHTARAKGVANGADERQTMSLLVREPGNASESYVLQRRDPLCAPRPSPAPAFGMASHYSKPDLHLTRAMTSRQCQD
jgi:hypothetical protein